MVGRELQLFYPVSPLSHVGHHILFYGTHPCHPVEFVLLRCRLPHVSTLHVTKFQISPIPHKILHENEYRTVTTALLLTILTTTIINLYFFLTDQVTNGISQRKRINSLRTI